MRYIKLYCHYNAICFSGCLAFLIIALCCLVGCVAPKKSSLTSNQNGVIQAVDKLGRGETTSSDYSNNVSIVKMLASCPEISVNALVDELEPVNIIQLDCSTNDAAENAKARHIMWCLRALYCTTGRRVSATSSYVFNDSEFDDNRAGLMVAKDGRWAFFVEWMSRGSVYFGPIDAQEKIISDWKMWAKRDATNYRYPQSVDFDNWYFGGAR